jgi:ribosomal subunit interface protein
MDVIVRGRHMEVSDSYRTLATEKLERVERFGLDIARVDVEVSKEPNPRMADRAIEVEINCYGKGPLIRVESHAADKYAALDDACGRLTERLRRASDKRRSKRRRRARLVAASSPLPEVENLSADEQPSADTTDYADVADAPDVVVADGPVLVREKRHATEPMTVMDALDEMEAVGHDFFFFHDAEADQASVLYRRRGYDYGLIRLEVGSIDGRAAS